MRISDFLKEESNEESNVEFKERDIDTEYEELFYSMLVPNKYNRFAYKVEEDKLVNYKRKSFDNQEYYEINLAKYNMQGVFENHILVCGYKEGLDYMIETIRRESEMPICILTDSNTKIEVIKLCNKYSYMYRFVGSSLNVNHLKNACIETAYHVVILNH